MVAVSALTTVLLTALAGAAIAVVILAVRDALYRARHPYTATDVANANGRWFRAAPRIVDGDCFATYTTSWKEVSDVKKLTARKVALAGAIALILPRQ